jgi:glycogen debranching enzyme
MQSLSFVSRSRRWARTGLGALLLFSAARAGEPVAAPATDAPAAQTALARRILADSSLDQALAMARDLLRTGFNAGSGYREVWIRDFATFIEISCQVYDRARVRENLLMFFRLQGDDGNIVDGFIPREQANASYRYLKKATVPDYWGHKNTVETDQETSLVQAVATYVRVTGDRAFLAVVVDGQPVRARLERAMEFLLAHRWNAKYGLLWGATTVDWGDVQPEHPWGVELNAHSHLCLDIYDNAMWVIALRDLAELLADQPERARRWNTLRRQVAANIRRHLWDAGRQKFIPHVYLADSPFPADFDENAITYHGGTAVAMQAGLLSPDEIRATLRQMRRDVRATGAASIGLTVYPPYPAGFFQNPSMRPYGYQNGGDWTWFGGRLVQALVAEGFPADAYAELQPMVRRVLKNKGFHEWYDIYNQPRGSGTYRGSAGVLGKAILMLRDWARKHAG